MILVIDNYDSFTYNLVQIVGTFNPNIKIVRNDKFTLNDIKDWRPTHIIISPGPGRPESAGLSVNIITRFGPEIPILGVCLGHQAITVAYGGKVIHSSEIVHGKTAEIIHDGSVLFGGLPNSFIATRYHSLVAERNSLPEILTITAHLENGLIMGVKHRDYSVFGVQFHPESIATKYGSALIENFLRTQA